MAAVSPLPSAAAPATQSLFTSGKPAGVTPSTSFGSGFSFAPTNAPSNPNANIFSKPANPLFSAQPGAFMKGSSSIDSVNATPSKPSFGSSTFSFNSGGTGGFLSGLNTPDSSETKPPPASLNPPSTTSTTASSSAIQEKVEEIYRKYNPSKMSDIPKILEKYQGRENELITNLEKKYNISSSTPATSSPAIGGSAAPPAGMFNFGNTTGAPSSGLFGNNSSGFGKTSAFGAATTSSFSSPSSSSTTLGFGSTSSFGATSTFGSSGFGATNTLGSSVSFGNTSASTNLPAFGSSTGFGTTQGQSFQTFASQSSNNSPFNKNNPNNKK